MIAVFGEIWIPCFPFVQEYVERWRNELAKHFEIAFVADPNANALYLAAGLPETEAVLMKCPDKLNNSNQSTEFVDGSPFIRLIRKDAAGRWIKLEAPTDKTEETVTEDGKRKHESPPSSSSSSSSSLSSSSSSSSSTKIPKASGNSVIDGETFYFAYDSQE